MIDTTFLTPQQLILLEFVKEKHGDQVRKGNGEPYWYHLVRVAKTCYDLFSDYNSSFGMIEAALCHDLLEDTDCTIEDLSFLCAMEQIFDFTVVGNNMLQAVIDLTDVFTKEEFPNLNRKDRKRHEADRLAEISPFSQTIKYADILDNTKDMGYDSGFEKVWLNEAREIMRGMNQGNPELYQRVIDAIYKNTNR